MNLQPLGDRLIVEVLEEEETTVERDRPAGHGEGEAAARHASSRSARARATRDGEHIPMDVAEGDEIIFSKYGGTEIKLGADEVLILRESDVLAKVVGDARACRRQRVENEEERRHGSQGAEVQRGCASRARARREHPRRRGQGHAWPEGALRRARQEVRRADDHERRRHDRP